MDETASHDDVVEQSVDKHSSSTESSVPDDAHEKRVETPKKQPEQPVPEEKKAKKTRKDFYSVSKESSHSNTKYYKKRPVDADFKVVTKKEFLSISDSISGSSDTFHCVHGPEGKKYSTKALLKRNLQKQLDPIPVDPNWDKECPPAYDWEMVAKLEFMVQSPTIDHQIDRLKSHLQDLAVISKNGFRVDTLKSLCAILDFLLESVHRLPCLREKLVLLLNNLTKPILLTATSDVVTHFNMISHFMGFLGYLLIRIDEDNLFDIVSKAIVWHLSAPDKLRGPGTVHLRHALAAAAVLQQTTVRMIAVATSHRFPTFLEIALMIACHTADNCIAMMKENIIENIFYRFNPYFPERNLPFYDINPHSCQDPNLKLGDSSVSMTTTLSLLLVLVKTTKQYLEQHPEYKKILPPPDCYAQRCFIWAYRYECRAREHRHERITLTVIAAVLVKCFGDRLLLFSSILMPDVMSLSVLTELPPRNDWISTVNFNTSQQDVQFKKILIYFVVDLLKVFPYNKFMMESRHWLLGIMYLLDPGLCFLRARWSPPLFAELRKTALQAMVCTIPLSEPRLVKQYGMIRRIMWYIEWYSESPYEIQTLYWCLRVLQVAIYHNRDVDRGKTMQDLFDTHGIIILIHLCYTLMEQKSLPPMEKSQAVIALSLRLLTSAVNTNQRIACCVYPHLKWPASVTGLAKKMLDVVLYSLNKHFIISDRWLVSLLNFIWEAIIWKPEYREQFVANDGIYKLLDIITMTRPAVQCVALALVCDIARAGDAVGQLVSWRASLGASNANPIVVRRGATIASLLAAVFREGCISSGVRLNEYGVLQDLEFPIMSLDAKQAIGNTDLYMISHTTPICLAAADMEGSSLSKAFAILQMLSEDLEYRVSLADEAYNLYKNIQLPVEDEVMLVLCSHYLTLKLNEVWKETKMQTIEMFERDRELLDDFVNVGKGWAVEIKRQQNDVIAVERKKGNEEESSLYAFLGRVRLNIALDALRSVRCVARSTARGQITHALLHDAVFAHHRRSMFEKKTNETLLRTYKPPLDYQNITGQNVKVTSIQPKDMPKPRMYTTPTEETSESK